MDHLRQDLRYIVRSLVKTPGFALLAILTLAMAALAWTLYLAWRNRFDPRRAARLPALLCPASGRA